MRMYAEEDKGIVFFETVLSLRKQRHTSIECIPVPWEQFDLLPGYFKVREAFVFHVQNSVRSRNLFSPQKQNGPSIES